MGDVTGADTARVQGTANRGLALFRAFFAALALAALTTQGVAHLNLTPPGDLGNFFSYYTIESNVIIAVVLGAGAVSAWRGVVPRWLDFARGAATVYISMTGLIYSLLLSNIDVNTPLPWVNVALHYTLPTIAVIDWLVDLPQRRISVRQSLIWLIFPALYLVYSLIRGSITGWYPYPFLNPANGGYGYVAIMSLFVGIVALLFVLVAAWSTRLRPQLSHTPGRPGPEVQG